MRSMSYLTCRFKPGTWGVCRKLMCRFRFTVYFISQSSAWPRDASISLAAFCFSAAFFCARAARAASNLVPDRAALCAAFSACEGTAIDQTMDQKRAAMTRKGRDSASSPTGK